MNNKKTLFAATVIAILASTAVTTAPAQAADFSVAVSKTSNLFRAGDSVAVTITGTPDTEGVYVRFCAAPATAGTRPTDCFGQGLWASTDSVMLGYGALPLTAPLTLSVTSAFTSGASNSIDCTTQSCGVFVRRDHLGPTDTSLDTFVPVTFAPAFGVTLSKSADLVRAGDSIDVNVVGLPINTGVYARLCAKPATEGTRPTDCFGQGDWASNDPQWFGVGALDVANPLPLAVQASFTANGNTISCGDSNCVVFVRRDHLNGADTSFDTLIPVSFASVPPKPAAKAIIKASHGKGQVVVQLSNAKGTKVDIYVGGKKHSVTVASDSSSFKFNVKKNSKNQVRVIVAGSKLLEKRVTS